MAAAPYYINDVFLLFPMGYGEFVGLDYLSRLLSLVILGCYLSRKSITRSNLGLKLEPGVRLFYWTIVIMPFVVLMAFSQRAPLYELFPYEGLAQSVPYDCKSLLYLFDYHVGLMFVAVTEEVIFRGLFLNMAKFTRKPLLLCFVFSPLLFAAAHWSSSPLNMASAFVFGVLFMIPTYRTGSVIPAVIGHYVANRILLGC